MAIDKILKDPELNYYVSTDYGETFRQFRQNHMDTLTKRTTLIIMGDARTNYLHPEDRILAEMRERCRRVIWLNPEPETAWNTGDSEMYAYRQHCTSSGNAGTSTSSWTSSRSSCCDGTGTDRDAGLL